MLDDLAGEFKLNTKEVINRIKALEENQALNGVIDERGKYIYITENEMLVTLYIKIYIYNKFILFSYILNFKIICFRNLLIL